MGWRLGGGAEGRSLEDVIWGGDGFVGGSDFLRGLLVNLLILVVILVRLFERISKKPILSELFFGS